MAWPMPLRDPSISVGGELGRDVFDPNAQARMRSFAEGAPRHVHEATSPAGGDVPGPEMIDGRAPCCCGRVSTLFFHDAELHRQLTDLALKRRNLCPVLDNLLLEVDLPWEAPSSYFLIQISSREWGPRVVSQTISPCLLRPNRLGQAGS